MFKNILISLMQLNGLNQTDLARHMNTPKTTINGWLNADRLPDYTAIKRLSAFFDVPASTLLEQESAEQPSASLPALAKQTETELELIRNFRQLPENLQNRALGFVVGLVEQEKQNLKPANDKT